MPDRIADGSAVVVGDAPTGSFTGMRLPTRYSFSSIGFGAVEDVLEVVALAARARAAATAS